MERPDSWRKVIGICGIGMVLAYALGILSAPMFRSDEAPEQLDGALAAKETTTAEDAQTAAAPKGKTEDNTTRDVRERISIAEWMTRMNELERPTPEQLVEFVEARGSSPESLIAAASLAEDGKPFLKKAMERHPDAPIVQLQALISMKDLSPEERLKWANKFRESQPNNAVANILAARAKIETDDFDGGLEELRAIAEQPDFDDFGSSITAGRVDALLHSGYSYVEARAKGKKTVNQALSSFQDTAASIRRKVFPTLEEDARKEAIAYGVTFGNRLSQGDAADNFGSELVGITIEKTFLNAMEPEERPAFLETTVGEAQASLQKQRSGIINQLNAVTEEEGSYSENDFPQFFDRAELVGEEAAFEWLQNSQPKPEGSDN